MTVETVGNKVAAQTADLEVHVFLRNAALALLSLSLAGAQELSKRPEDRDKPAPTSAGKLPNSHPAYAQMKPLALSGETLGVNNLVLKRDIGTFTFNSGTFAFFAPVNGKPTGALFTGTGKFRLEPTLASEKQNLSILTKQPVLEDDFQSLVLRFTDDTFEELKTGRATNMAAPASSGEIADHATALRKKMRLNLTARILQDAMREKPSGVFYAFIKGRNFTDKQVFAIDPQGALGMNPEEVVYMTWDDNRGGIWVAQHLREEYGNGKANGTQEVAAIDIEHHKLDAQIEKNGRLSGDSTTTFRVKADGLQLVYFDLFRTLRVQSVTGEGGEALDFIQEDKDEDADFYVVLPRAMRAGESYKIRTIYSGKDAVSNEGGGNYFPVARHNWYPNAAGLEDYATYEMIFRVPKGMKLAGTGEKLKEYVEGDFSISEFRSRGKQSVAGFNFGRMKSESIKLQGLDFEVESFANTETPDWLRPLEEVQSVSTTGMMKKAAAEAELSIRLYTDYFGPTPFKKISMTQQTASNFGQAWPELVYLPLSSFLDSLTRFRVMGFDPKGYFKVVGPHEVAHQWWGHTVGWSSYRDQWMSEGFSQLSASLYIQMIEKNPKGFIKYWDDLREQLVERNREGFRAIDVGPLTMGYRLNNSKSGDYVTQNLIYPKGGYVLHMVRMMMWDPKTGDERFKAMMKEFVKTHTQKPASTEDFKAMLEKHMLPGMNLEGNQRMDWFFNQYVYGTGLPKYTFAQSIQSGAEGTVLKFKLTQSGVNDNFRMLVPIYLEMANGKVGRLGSATIVGNTTVEESVNLGKLKDPPKKALLSYYNDVLAIVEMEK